MGRMVQRPDSVMAGLINKLDNKLKAGNNSRLNFYILVISSTALGLKSTSANAEYISS